MAVTQLSDVIVPRKFLPYVQQQTKELSVLVQSGAVASSSALDDLLRGGGNIFNIPSFRDLSNTDEDISSDNPAVSSTPDGIGSAEEVGVRLCRNKSWGAANLVNELIGEDPMAAIGQRVAKYRARRLEQVFIATMTGVFADNAAAPSGGDTHTQDDLTVDISGGGYVAGVTDFNAESFIDALFTMGDAAQDLTILCVHSTVYSRMLKNNLIDFRPDADASTALGTFMNRTIIQSDLMPNPSSGIFHTWLFGPGALQLGLIPAKKRPVATSYDEAAGNGAGTETLHLRWELCLHPVGHAWIAAASGGGPSNANTSGNLAHAASWSRRYPERKQISIARLITRES